MERFNSFSSDQIILTKRQASMVMASMLLFCLFVFIAGYFLGKRTLIDDFSATTTKESLHDQIDLLLTTQSLQSSQEGQAVSEDEPLLVEEKSLQDEITVADQEMVIPEIITEERESQKQIKKEETIKSEDNVVVNSPDVKKSQHAQLIGFGTKKAAQAFVARLKKHDIPVILKTMMSKTASGKQRTWYQAITPTYDSLKELQDQIVKIKRLEHIRDKDIRVVHTK